MGTVLTLVYLPLTAIQRSCDSWWRLLLRSWKLFFFSICQVFNANLPLLVTSAFPSSRLLLFSLKRLWSPTDPGDLHRTSLVKCLGWIRRDGWGREGSSPICALFTHNPIGKRQHPAVQIDSPQDSTPALQTYLVFYLVQHEAFSPPSVSSVIYLFTLCFLICNLTHPRPSL